MTEPTSISPAAPVSRTPSGLPLYSALAAVMAFFIVSAGISHRNVQTLREATDRVSHTHGVIAALEDVFSLMRDAESGQRGLIITGEEKYLEPYTA
ncbi:MAG: hypothetical protein EOP86_25380, partial [Verrucomicrobiaceae bacterium]